ncbi:hypothetical protein SAMN06295967_10939 [Belliella buryatensis]|uniref:PKD domain-containing protein n=1 Tax=Belliella buryatensis TaxID=1500549 RepID=A0A239E9J2_9BACT|nr:hypothetical protein [Belliella buryatensis]SNS41287.1 hypothetical protein SAMN06295967_10939 [Belliella buryatensis]
MKNTFTNYFKATLWSVALVFGMMACAQMEDLDRTLDSEIMRKSSPINTGNFLNARVGSYTNEGEAGPYDISLNVENNNDGTFTWTWDFANREGAQDISHWNIIPAECLELGDIVTAEFNIGNGWVSFDPTFGEDSSVTNGPSASLDCAQGTDVLKFDAGTSNVSYRLVLNKAFSVDMTATSVFKGGNDPACGIITYPGIGCDTVIEEDTCYKDETAWSFGTRFNERGNWAMYTAYESGKEVALIAGQHYEIGTVSFGAVVDGEVEITISLNADGAFQDVASNVKIQGYDKAPSGNPAPGRFAFHGDASGSTFTATVPAAKFYGVHVDAARVVECPIEE